MIFSATPLRRGRLPCKVKRTQEVQAHRIVTILSDWIHASPGRSAHLTETADGWKATLQEVRSASGSTPLDALAQVALVAEMENAEWSA